MTARENVALYGAASVRRRTRSSTSGLIRFIALLVCLAALAHRFQYASAREFRFLDPLTETKIEHIEEFVAADSFKIGIRIGGRALSAVGLNFTEHFLSVVEKNVPATSLRSWALLYTIGDKSLIDVLGGEQEVGLSSLAYIYRAMEMGDEGPSHTDWQSNFAYVRSPIDRRLWAVHWTVNYANEWTIGAVYVPHPHLDWRSGSRLFGHKPMPLQALRGT